MKYSNNLGMKTLAAKNAKRRLLRRAKFKILCSSLDKTVGEILKPDNLATIKPKWEIQAWSKENNNKTPIAKSTVFFFIVVSNEERFEFFNEQAFDTMTLELRTLFDKEHSFSFAYITQNDVVIKRTCLPDAAKYLRPNDVMNITWDFCKEDFFSL